MPIEIMLFSEEEFLLLYGMLPAPGGIILTSKAPVPEFYKESKREEGGFGFTGKE